MLYFNCNTLIYFFHQLAILASYSGNDLVAVYRYFRSLAVDSPFSTARDNLIIAFEKVLICCSLTSACSAFFFFSLYSSFLTVD